MLPNWNSSNEYCSELVQSSNISVHCRAVGIPMPQVDILVNGNIMIEPYRKTRNEVVLISAPIPYGEVVMFECRASTAMVTTSVIVNLTYTCKCSYMIVPSYNSVWDKLP